eukprot:TRINITY_DN55_c0_g1_i2.p1 TRINITY_DN55_c0_g1~~TRINITY_DN55_c0_g1_i2.p1  ORF type:complete len:1001 (-),score=301.93 TRINITY_DN55_c0_g1_i2:28-3030(-)
MGRKNRKNDDYWENADELDENWLDSKEKEDSEEVTKAKTNKQNTDANSEEIVITGKKKKASKQTNDKEQDEPKETEESDIVITGKKKKTNKPSETTKESNENDSENIVISGKKKKNNKKSDTKVESNESQTTVSADTTENSATISQPEGVSTDAKKKKKKGAASTTSNTTSVEKEEKSAPKKKGGIGKKLAEQLAKMREEEERKRKEEEERRLKEEEEERLRQQQEEEEEKQRQIEKEERKKLAKERKALQQKEQEEKKKEAIRQQLLATGVQLPALNTNEPKKKKIVYGDKKKKKPSQQQEEPQQEAQVADSQPDNKISEKPEQVEAKEVVADSWEDNDLDDWEKKIEPEISSNKDVKPTSSETLSQVASAKKPENSTEKDSKSTEVGTKPVEANKEEELRSPIVCILGHVDTGKTKLLDKIRHTNVQEGEAGGITQQIGATFFPMEAIKEQTKSLNEQFGLTYKVPGLLIIDTPGHESFTNLRSRGSGLCDIAILVVDIMHGLEPQTIESINLLRMRKTPFIVALNKVDRIYGWKSNKNEPIQQALQKQSRQVVLEYEERVKETIGLFASQGLNAQLYYKNKSLKEFRTMVSLVPTSAIEGTGIPDLLMLLIQLTQKLMADRLLSLSTLQCTVLEVKVVEGLGTTIDVILVNGILHEGDTIVVCGLNGPIVTTIRALLTPQPMKEMRVKGSYIHHKTIKAAQGIKICAQELDKAVAGSSLFVVKPGDDIESVKEEVMADLENMRKRIDTSGKGVWVQASTLGSLEALLEFLKESKIPVSGVNIGPVNKKDVIRASVMLEHKPEYAVILAFDVKVSKEAKEIADEMGVKIFTAEIIYHLFDQFTAYIEKLKNDQKAAAAPEAVFPCRLKIYPEYIFNKKDPIVLGVEVVEGSLRIGTPIVVPAKGFIDLGKVTSIELNHKAQEKAKKGTSVAIKIEVPTGEQQKAFGRHFDQEDELVSKISRQSVDLLKANFREEVDKEDVHLLKKLKDLFEKHGKFGN